MGNVYMDNHKKSRLKFRIGVLFVAAALIFVACYSSFVNTDEIELYFNNAEIAEDMFLPHEGNPAGVPSSWSWARKPASSSGLGHGFKMPPGYDTIQAWGQVYADENMPNPDVVFPFVRVQIKDLQLFLYYDDGTWEMVKEAKNPVGNMYWENFKNDEHFPANPVRESSGGISITAGSGKNFHFWTDRVRITDGSHIKGVFVVCKARLIGTENYNSPSKYMISIGGDYWDTFNSLLSTGGENVDIGCGRFKYVTPKWQYFTMHSFSREAAKNVKFPLE